MADYIDAAVLLLQAFNNGDDVLVISNDPKETHNLIKPIIEVINNEIGLHTNVVIIDECDISRYNLYNSLVIFFDELSSANIKMLDRAGAFSIKMLHAHHDAMYICKAIEAEVKYG